MFSTLCVFLFFQHFVESFKAPCVFFGIVLLTLMVSTSNVQSIENLNGNNYHTWKMKMEYLLHGKYL